MGRRFKPLEPFRGWRKLAVHSWHGTGDPSTYSLVDIRMQNALDYMERLRRETGIHVTLTHLVARGVALAFSQFPGMNGIVAHGRIYTRDTVDIFMQVATEGGKELSGIKVSRADQKSVLDIAREVEERVALLRARRDQQVERTKSILDRVPTRLLGPMMKTIAYLIYDLDLDLTRFGIVKDEFGSAMVTNAGTFGVGVALAPLIPFSRTPMVVLMGALEDRVIAVDGRAVVEPMLTLGATLDHRVMDGYHGGHMIKICRGYLEDPEPHELRLPRPMVAAAGATSSL